MDFLSQWIDHIFNNTSNFTTFVTDNITKTPADIFGKDFWNSLLKVGMSAVMPFAITLLCYAMANELYRVYCKSNGAMDLELVATTIVKFILPFVLITKTYDFLQLIFTAINGMVSKIYAAVTIGTGNSIDTSAWAQQISQMNFMQKLGLIIQLWGPYLGMALMTVVATVIVYGRIFELVFYWLFAPIPFALFISEEYSNVAKNFIKMFCALILQGGFMILSVVMYLMLIKSVSLQASIAGSFEMFGYTCVLGFALVKSGALAKRLLGTF